MNTIQVINHSQPSVGSLRMIPYDTSESKYYVSWISTTVGNTTFNFSSHIPVGATAAYIRAYLAYNNLSGTAPVYIQCRVHFSNVSGFTAEYRNNSACLSTISYTPNNSFCGGDIVTAVPLDSNRYFYGRIEMIEPAGCRANVWVVLLGYFL